MKKIFCCFLFLTAAVFCELPILRTRFRTAGVDVVQAQAQQKNPEAMVELALRLYAGHQVEQNLQLSFEWMSAAAELNYGDAQILLSRMYVEGIGTPVDSAKSEFWFARALAGNPNDAKLVTEYKQRVAEKSGDAESLRNFLKVCADAGFVPAAAELKRPEASALYAKGDYENAAGLFRSLAAANDPLGFYYLARMHFLGQGGVSQDYVEAVDLYLKAAEGGSVGAQYELALLYETGTAVDVDREQALRWFEKAAAGGHSSAQFKLAEIKFADAVLFFDRAEMSAKNSPAQTQNMKQYNAALSAAVELYRRAAAANVTGAQYMLGRLSASGEGVVKNPAEAIRFYEQAAVQNHADSLFYLGQMHHAGLGVSKDVNRAVALYKQAADAGSRGAMFYLGNGLRFGTAGEKNLRKGAEIYRQKVLSGVDPSDENSELLKNEWVLRAALEYGIIQQQSNKPDARSWMALAAGGEIPGARAALIGAALNETPVEPSKDAVARKRDSAIIFPSISEPHRKMFPGAPVLRVISSAVERNTSIDVTGARQFGLIVSYKSPVISQSIGLQGVVQVGVEFEDTKTGEQFWSFNRVPDERKVSSDDVVNELSVIFKLNNYPNVRLKGWIVEYGHLFDDGRLVGLMDERHKSSISGTLENMAFRNYVAKKIPSIVTMTHDLSRLNISSPDAVMPEQQQDSESIFDPSQLFDLLDHLNPLEP